MPTWRLELEYEGTRYRGWQIQHNTKTIQGEMAAAARELFTAPAEIFSGEPTVAGVHALSQTVHLKVPELKTRLTPAMLLEGFNGVLPADINVIAAAEAPDTFHARRDAVGRSYLYQISKRRSAFGKPFIWWVKAEHDVEAMKEAIKAVVGRHDLKSFGDLESDTRIPTVVDISAAEVFEDGDLICIRVIGSHFLPLMMRRIVGLIAEVGRSDMTYDAFARLLKFPSPVPAKYTAPPSGLFLEKVLYKGDKAPVEKRGFMRIG